MKKNFLISVNKKAWIADSKKLFIAEPYIYHAINKENETKNYEEIEIAPPLWQSRNEFLEAHTFIDQKYHKYIPLLADRLNTIHKRNYDDFFWKKCFSLGLLRYITFNYQIFQIGETFLRPEKHDCRILSKKSYSIPKNFNDHRDLFQYTAFGQEQLFSIYANVFYPEYFAPFDDQFDWRWNNNTNIQSIRNIISRIYSSKVLTKVSQLIYGNMLKQYYSQKNLGGPKVGIMNCFFFPNYVNELIIRSKGCITPIPLKTNFTTSTDVDWEKRKVLSSIDSDFDKFDQFFFTSLEHCLPKEFVEDFEQIETYYKNYFEKYMNLEYIVSEAWIGDTYTSIAIAILQSKGIKHICNEHNYLSHQFLNTNLKYIFPLVDSFVTLGWEDRSVKNLIKGSSLFKFSEKKIHKKEYDILFISSLALAKLPEFNSAYGESGSKNAFRFLKFDDSFFKNLRSSTLKKIVFRPYPVRRWPVSSVKPSMLYYDYLNGDMNPHLKHFREINQTDENSKLLIAKSKLVIVDYLSTTYLEALLSDIPTIFFWDKERYYLNDEFADIYDVLISVGICQTDPVQSAHFVEQVMNSPLDWWQSESVKNARETFLSRNIGSPEIMIDYLLTLADKSPQ